MAAGPTQELPASPQAGPQAVRTHSPAPGKSLLTRASVSPPVRGLSRRLPGHVMSVLYQTLDGISESQPSGSVPTGPRPPPKADLGERGPQALPGVALAP